MTVSQRITLLLIAFPFSAALAVIVFMTLDVSRTLAASIALGVFATSEALLGYGASRIPSWSGRDALIGREAEVLSEFVPDGYGSYSGYVRLDGERWKGRLTTSHPPRPGARVRVEGSEGLVLRLVPPADA